MKYIRTKDGIYSYEPTHDIDVDGFIIQHNLTGWNKPLMKEDIIKITDTIEELCDEFVIFGLFDIPYLLPKLQLDYYNRLEQFGGKVKSNRKYEIKGAIWTEWGLKYIAKMNDKGEFELL